jgi:hypothetical protein
MTNDDNKSLVFEYFRMIKEKDIDGLLGLFSYDAAIYEPFSKLSTAVAGSGFRERTTMEAFFQVSAMIIEGLEYDITLQGEIEVGEEYTISSSSSKSNNNITRKDQKSSIITALVRFKRGRSASAIFAFETINYPTSNGREERRGQVTKIKNLRIEFLSV